MSYEREEIIYGPNVELIRKHATRVIVGKVPSQVRKELNDAVKNGHLGRLKRDGLKPEIYFHPDHLHGARDRQKREAEYVAAMAAKAVDVDEYRIRPKESPCPE